MIKSKQKPQYTPWSDNDIKKLIQLVKQVGNGKTYIDWQYVARQMSPRTIQQCKSYYGQLIKNNTLQTKYNTEEFKDTFDAKQQYQLLDKKNKMLLYTLPQYYSFDWVTIQSKIPQYNTYELQELFKVSQQSVAAQQIVIQQIADNSLKSLSTRQLKNIYCNFNVMKYALQIDQLYKNNVDEQLIPQPPPTYDGIYEETDIQYPPQPYLINFFKEILIGIDLESALMNIVIELSHRND
ncbi:Myb-like_DNA-binding domain-containing protein [Hexamita inflata]|uniref:Myb-like DNA-binding domain-containing protein n=1 Tax=Hexamita inflata TaxID=28002 RepID=A0AA86RRQ6_9EUKA|nr:Myb-like DNA-binding domain-containing protein [Hexamita inflata]